MMDNRSQSSTERRGIHRRQVDIKHIENQARFKALEDNQAEIRSDQAQILEQMKELAGLFEFLRDARVGIKWSGRIGKAIIWIGKLATGILAITGLWKLWEHFVK